MNREEYAAWVQAAWEKEVLKRTPLAKSLRSAKAGNQAMKREHKSVRRSLAAGHGSKMRALKKQQVEDEAAMRKRWAALDAESEERRWRLLMGLK